MTDFGTSCDSHKDIGIRSGRPEQLKLTFALSAGLIWSLDSGNQVKVGQDGLISPT